jgi:hypothetical protein
MRLYTLFAGLLAALPGSALMAQELVPGANPDPSILPPKILLKYAEFDPIQNVPAVPPMLAGSSDVHLWLVQYHEFPTDMHRNAIRSFGGEIISYMPEKSYLIRIPHAGAANLSRAAGVRWMGSYHPAYRLEPELRAEFLSGAYVPVRKYNFVVANKHEDKPALIAAVQGMGGKVVHEHPESILFTAELSGVQLIQAARLDQVIWIDRWTESSNDMDNVRIVGGGNFVESVAGYTGQGIRGHVYEGVERTHNDFNTAPTVVGSCSTADSHGHCTAGIVFGNGNSIASARGMAPNARPYYTNYGCVNTGLSRYQVLQQVVNTHNCVFTTASWGAARTTSYTSISADTDDIIFNLNIPWTQSQSNAGGTSNPRNSRPQAWAKNTFSIGAVRHYNNSNVGDDKWAQSGSIGFAADGRIKPDLCAYYDSIQCSDRTGSAGYSSGDYYNNFGGTSAATPIVAGHNALAIQMFTDGVFNNALRKPGGTRFENKPHFTTLRALQIANARQYTFTSSSTDNKREHQGWGFPNLKTMYENRNRMFIVDETDVLTQGTSKVYSILVPAGTPELKVAMCFNDPAGNPASSIARINDLDLRVYNSSSFYRGNVGLKTGNYSTTGGSYDNRDTTEAVIIKNPTAGIWTVSVYARTIAADSHKETSATDADFGLVVSGAVLDGSKCDYYVPDDAPDQGSGNVIPFGYDSSTWRNQIAQFIIRRDDLGRSGAIHTLGFASLASGRHSFENLRIRMSHVSAGHTLSTNFSSNMPRPVTVLNSRKYVWVRSADQWSSIGLQTPFVYNGSSDIVVEVLTQGADVDLSSSVAGVRRGLRERVYAYNWTGKPPTTGTLGSSSAPKMRVGFGCADRNVYGVGAAPDRGPSVAVPAFASTFSGGLTRGLWFKAPLDFQIVGLRVPNEARQTQQAVEVFKRSTPPADFGSSSTGGRIFYKAGVPAGEIIPCTLDIKQGEYVCILGACGSTSRVYNSYGSNAPYQGSILGHPVTLNRLLTQSNIFAGGNQPYSNEPSGSIGRVEIYVKNQLPLPAFSSTFSGSLTRGYYFQTPVDFNLIGLRVPDESQDGKQNVEVYRWSSKPPAWSSSISTGRVFRRVGYDSSKVIPCYLSFKAGDWVGILGACGDASGMKNSYGPAQPTSSIRGQSVTLYRLITQRNIASTATGGVSAEDSGSIGRVELFLQGEGFGATIGGMPRLGETFEFQINGSSPSFVSLLNIGISNGSFLPLNLSGAGFGGSWLYTDLTLLLAVPTDPQGIGRLPIQLPTTRDWIGAKLYMQGVLINKAAPGGIGLSDYVRMVSGN